MVPQFSCNLGSQDGSKSTVNIGYFGSDFCLFAGFQCVFEFFQEDLFINGFFQLKIVCIFWIKNAFFLVDKRIVDDW